MNSIRWLLSAAILTAPAFAQTGPVVPGAYRLMDADSPDTTGAGLVLISELKCGACHDLPAAVRESINWELKRTRPLSQASPHYVRAFIDSPASALPGATMPKVSLTADEANRLAEFVQSLVDTDSPSSSSGSVERGADLYHTVGCVACHAPMREPGSPVDEDDPFATAVTVEYPAPLIPSIPIRNNLGSITKILMQTPKSRMPHLKLRDEEANAIAAYLKSGAITAANRTAIKKGTSDGEALFNRVGCAQCHRDTVPTVNYVRAKIIDHNRGCLAEVVSAPAVDYALSADQRSAIRDALAIESPRDDASWQVLGMAAAHNCLACHQRDGFGGAEPGRAPFFTTTVDADLGDEGRIPPTLTGVGAKLTRESLKAVLTGHGDARPYMATRMPLFALGDVDPIVAAFEEADRNTLTAEVDVSGLAHHHRNHYGRELVGTDALGCVSCHELNGHRSLGIPAIDLARAPTRLRPEWFMAYMRDPASLRPGTRMPAYFPGDMSTYPGLFKGNPRQQIEAIWIYLREIDQTRLPKGMEDSAQYIVVPRDAPVIHRTFMKDVGARSIAVGFPEGIHFAFDATNVRASLAWRGDFLDANSTWNDRFSPYVEALGDDRWTFPRMMPFAIDGSGAWPTETGANAAYQFKGFTLDDSGTPAFRYVFAGMKIYERLSPLPNSAGLQRLFTIESANSPVRFMLARGDNIEQTGRHYTVDATWTTRLDVRKGEVKIAPRPEGSTSIIAIFIPENGRIEFTQDIEW